MIVDALRRTGLSPIPPQPVRLQLRRYPRRDGYGHPRAVFREPEYVPAEHQDSHSRGGIGKFISYRQCRFANMVFIQLIMRSTNPRDVAYISRDYARKIHAKALPSDPDFLRISVACGKVRDLLTPSQTTLSHCTLTLTITD
jgi:hypothetical protein